jgi:hypothetical protein
VLVDRGATSNIHGGSLSCKPRVEGRERFGPLPASAWQQLEAADLATLEAWSLRLLEAASLEDRRGIVGGLIDILRVFTQTVFHLPAERPQTGRFLIEKERPALHHSNIEALPQIPLG